MILTQWLDFLSGRCARAPRSRGRSFQKPRKRIAAGIEPLETRMLLSADPGPFVVSTLLDETDGDFSSGNLSLREALDLAAEQAGDDVIRFVALSRLE